MRHEKPTRGAVTLLLVTHHDGHASAAVHRIVGRKLFDEIGARAPVPR